MIVPGGGKPGKNCGPPHKTFVENGELPSRAAIASRAACDNVPKYALSGRTHVLSVFCAACHWWLMPMTLPHDSSAKPVSESLKSHSACP